MRIALLAMGFFAGLWLHETGWIKPNASVTQRFKLTNIRHTIEASSCDRVRLNVRVVNSPGVKAALEPVLVCAPGATNDFAPTVTYDPLSLPYRCTTSRDARCFEGL